MNVRTAVFATAVAAIAAVPAAYAFPPPGVPSTVNPGLLMANGNDSKAIYAFADAGDTSLLNLTMPAFGGNPIFTNHPSPGAGATKDLGVLSGGIQFGLHDTSTGNTFLTNAPDGAGDFHAAYSGPCNSASSCNAAFTVFSVGALDPAVDTAINNVLAGQPGAMFTFVGWEDRTGAEGSDWDYNDLIFLFSNLKAQVPEPATLTLLGAGLVGLALARRRKK